MTPPRADEPSRMEVVDSASDGAQDALARAVQRGLRRRPLALPGSLLRGTCAAPLVRAVEKQPEFYLSDAERQIVKGRSSSLLLHFPTEAPAVIDLGRGDRALVRPMLEALLARDGEVHYLPVAPTREELEQSLGKLPTALDGLRVTGIVARPERAVREAKRLTTGPRLFVWLRAGLGAVDRETAATFARLVGSALSVGDAFVAGLDLRKSRRVIERAYDDRAGAAGRLDRHMLERINAELGGNFDLARFRHRASYDETAGRVDTCLVSSKRQSVAIDQLEMTVDLDRGEAIHTGSAFKYSPQEIDALAHAADLVVADRWYDRDGRYCLNVLQKVPTRHS